MMKRALAWAGYVLIFLIICSGIALSGAIYLLDKLLVGGRWLDNKLFSIASDLDRKVDEWKEEFDE